MGGRAAHAAVSKFADRPPTPDPSPPRADARGGRGEGGPSAPRLLLIRISNSHGEIELSLPGLTRQSIPFEKLFTKMDARIKFGHDE